MYEDQPDSSRSPYPTLLMALLWAVALFAVGVGMLLGVLVPVAAARQGQVGLITILVGVAWMTGGWGLAALLWATAWLISRPVLVYPPRPRAANPQEPDDDTSAFLTASRLNPSILHGLPRPSGPDRTDEVLTRLEQIERTLMLPAEELESMRRREHQQQVEGYVDRVEAAMDAQDFAEAKNVLEEFAAEFPNHLRCQELQGKVAEARRQAESEQFSHSVQRVEDLMAVSRFEDALTAAEQLAEQHPDSRGAEALVQRVRREHDAYRTERIGRLYKEVERAVTARQWGRSVELAEQFVDAYPQTPEAELLNVQMPTLRQNARIEEVRAYRDRIRDYIERRRFSEAVDLAKEVIRDYPETAAANELRGQLPRLKELADR
ncbi:MAG: tetratricopeptide repeat protein [Phycisphaerae bacterium]